jgi:hypothetical protein
MPLKHSRPNLASAADYPEPGECAFRSLALAGDEPSFLGLLHEQSLEREGLFALIDEDNVFAEMRQSYFYEELKRARD